MVSGGLHHPLACSHPLGPEGSKQRTQGLAFLRLAEAAQQGTAYNASKALFDVSTNQVETRQISLRRAWIAIRPACFRHAQANRDWRATLHFFLGTAPTVPAPNQLQLRVDALFCWAMMHCQINRPQSFGTPRLTEQERVACNLRPYAAFWQAVIDLDGFVTMEEFVNVLSETQTATDTNIIAAVQLIRSIRLGNRRKCPPDWQKGQTSKTIKSTGQRT